MTKPDLRDSLDLGTSPDLEVSIELVGQARKGDAQALNDLLTRYQDRLLRIVRIKLGKKMRNVMESVDVVQDTLRVAADRMKDFEPQDRGSLLQWLSRIAVNQIRGAHDHHFAQRRDHDREVPMVGADGGDLDPFNPDQTSPEDSAWKREVRALLDEAVGELPEQYRQAIVLRDYCGGSWEFVAQELERDSAHAAKQVHQRAWIRVRQLVWPKLRKDGDDAD